MDEERASYAADIGLLFEEFGLSRMAGRVLGTLLISDPPLSAGELAETLQASPGSISSATRALIGMELVQRVSRPGQRRDYFRMKPDAWNEMMRQELKSVFKFRQMSERGLEIVDSDCTDARRNLERMLQFFTYLEREIPAMLGRWEENRKETAWVR